MSKLLGSGNVAIFKDDLQAFNDAFALQKATAEKMGVASFGKQQFLGKCLREVLPHIQGIIFNGEKLATDDNKTLS